MLWGVQAPRCGAQVARRCRAEPNGVNVGRRLQAGGSCRGVELGQSRRGPDQALCREMGVRSIPMRVALQGCFPGRALG